MLARLDDPEELGVDEGEGEEEGEEDVADGVGESATGIAEEGGPTAAAVLGRAAFTWLILLMVCIILDIRVSMTMTFMMRRRKTRARMEIHIHSVSFLFPCPHAHRSLAAREDHPIACPTRSSSESRFSSPPLAKPRSIEGVLGEKWERARCGRSMTMRAGPGPGVMGTSMKERCSLNFEWFVEEVVAEPGTGGSGSTKGFNEAWFEVEEPRYSERGGATESDM
jgi:hypothetical protein